MGRPFSVIGFTVFFTAAILFDMKTGVTVTALAVFTVALVIALFSDKARNGKIIPAIAASGAIACILLLSAEYFYYQPALEYNGKNCDVKAVITSECEERYGNYYYEAKALTVDGEESGIKFRFVFSQPAEVEPYDIIEGEFNFFKLGLTNDEYLLSYKSKGLFMGAYSYTGKINVINVPESEKPFAKKIIDFRSAAIKAIYRILPDDRGTVAVALILGDKTRIPDEYIDNFSKSGIMHLVCVSGFHLSLWSFLVLKFLDKTRINRKISNLITIICVIGFMFVAGLSYSVIRSGIMMILFLVSDIVSRKRDSLNSLGFSLCVIALCNPFAMGSVGLQLSVSATLGLILYSRFFGEKIRYYFSKIKSDFCGKILRYICEGFLTTLAATAFILPITLRMNGGFDFGVFLANPLALPISEVCIILCSLGAIVGMLPYSVQNIPAIFGGFFVEMFIRLADKVSELDFLSVRVDAESAAVVLCGIGFIILASVLIFRNRKKMYGLTAVLCSVYFVAVMFVCDGIFENETRIDVIDCGNGMSVLVRADGENYLFGCGGTEFLSGVYITECVDEADGKLKAIILPDTSVYNSACFTTIVKDYKPEYVWCNGLPDDTRFLLGSSEVNDFSELNISGDVDIYGGEINDSRYAVFSNDDISALICFDPVDFSGINGEFDVIISRNDYPQGLKYNDCRALVISAESSRGELLEKEVSSKGINSVSTGGEGNIIIRASQYDVSLKREN